MTISVPSQVIQSIVESFGARNFRALDVADRLKTKEPTLWSKIVQFYGEGGHNAGSRYTAYSRIATALRVLERQGKVQQAGYSDAPIEFGSPIAMHWRSTTGQRQVQPKYIEGGPRTVELTVYERSDEARLACIAHHGVTCKACKFDFGAVYGARGHGYIHVHHRIPISQIGAEYKVDPVTDLVPVCANCHAIIHRQEPMLSIEELVALLTDNKTSSGTKLLERREPNDGPRA